MSQPEGMFSSMCVVSLNNIFLGGGEVNNFLISVEGRFLSRIISYQSLCQKKIIWLSKGWNITVAYFRFHFFISICIFCYVDHKNFHYSP